MSASNEAVAVLEDAHLWEAIESRVFFYYLSSRKGTDVSLSDIAEADRGQEL